MNKELKKAIAYVKENLEDYELAELNAQMEEAYAMHLMPDVCCNYDKVIDLLEEYGEDNELGESWWEEYGDINDILFEL